MQLTKDQVNVIMKNAPVGADKTRILDNLINKGYELEGVDTNAAKADIARRTQPVQPTAPESGGFLSNVKNDILKRGEAVQSEINNPNQNPLLSGIKATGQAFGAIGDVVGEGLTSIAPGVMEGIGNVVKKGSDAVINTVANTDLIKGAAQGDTSTLESGLSVAKGASDIANNILLAEGGAKSTQKAVDTTLNTVKKFSKNVESSIQELKVPTTTVIDKAPADIMQRVARITKGKQAAFEKTAGESVGEYLTRRGIYGNPESITEQLFNRFQKSKATADAALAELSGNFAPKQVGTALEELATREARVSAPGATSPDLQRVTDLTNKFKNEGLNMSEINEVKRLFERNIKVDFLKQNLPEGVARSNNIDKAIHDWQFQQADTLGLKNLGEINRETRLSKQLMDDLGKEYAGQAGNNGISLTDWVVLSGGNPQAIALYMVKNGLSNKTVMSSLAKYLNKGKPILSDVKADIGPSKVKQLPAGNTSLPQSQNNVPIKLMGPSSIEPQAKNIGNFKNTAVGQTASKIDKPLERPLTKKSQNATINSMDKLTKGALKYKSADEFVKAQLDKNSFTMNVNRKVYRGDGKGIGNSTLVNGQYFADTKEFASKFGNVSESIIPKGSKVFDLDKIKDGKSVIPQEMLVDNKALTKYLLDNGFDYTKNTNTRGVEFVKLNKVANELDTLANKSKDLSSFKKSVMNNYDKYRDELARLSKNYTNADNSRLRSPIDDIYNHKSPITIPKSQLTDIWNKANLNKSSEFINPIDVMKQDPMKIPSKWGEYTSYQKKQYLDELDIWNKANKK